MSEEMTGDLEAKGHSWVGQRRKGGVERRGVGIELDDEIVDVGLEEVTKDGMKCGDEL